MEALPDDLSNFLLQAHRAIVCGCCSHIYFPSGTMPVRMFWRSALFTRQMIKRWGCCWWWGLVRCWCITGSGSTLVARPFSCDIGSTDPQDLHSGGENRWWACPGHWPATLWRLSNPWETWRMFQRSVRWCQMSPQYKQDSIPKSSNVGQTRCQVMLMTMNTVAIWQNTMADAEGPKKTTPAHQQLCRRQS